MDYDNLSYMYGFRDALVFPSTCATQAVKRPASRRWVRASARKVAAAATSALVLVTLILVAHPVQAATYPCLGAPADEPNGGLYPEPRIFLENQAWWQPTVSGTEDHGHIHSGACIPRTHFESGEVVKVSGRMAIAIRTVVHDNPGLLRFSRVHLTTAAANHTGAFRGDIGKYCTTSSPHWSVATHGCVLWSTGTIDTTVSKYDGFQEIRASGNVRHDGSEDTMFSSGGWQVYLANGKPVKHLRARADGSARDFTEGRGWYLGANYTNAGIDSRIPYRVSGTWSVKVHLGAGAKGVDATRGYAAIDPNFHFGNAGTPIYDGAAPYEGTLSIDTTKLTNGLHRLFLRTDAPCDGTAGNNCGPKADGTTNNVSTNSGGLVVPFMVNN